MKKRYTLNGNQVEVFFNEGLIGITNDAALKRLVQANPEESVELLVRQINKDYRVYHGRALAITDDSFIVEIWGHIYFEHFLLKYRKLLQSILFFGLYQRLCKSCEVIDCGEKGKDPNRKVWDILSRYKKQFAKWLPKTIYGVQ